MLTIGHLGFNPPSIYINNSNILFVNLFIGKEREGEN